MSDPRGGAPSPSGEVCPECEGVGLVSLMSTSSGVPATVKCERCCGTGRSPEGAQP
jgi:DnaJ-class molecular chaperone